LFSWGLGWTARLHSGRPEGEWRARFTRPRDVAPDSGQLRPVPSVPRRARRSDAACALRRAGDLRARDAPHAHDAARHPDERRAARDVDAANAIHNDDDTRSTDSVEMSDRSVQAIDRALRRRFEFVEIPANSSSAQGWSGRRAIHSE
jgi:hypothetical protein